MTTPHSSRWPRLSLAAFVLVVLSIGPFAIAGAADASVATPTLTSSTVAAGGADDLTGGGCAARASVQVQLDGVVLVTTQSLATGRYSAHLLIPVSAKPGTHRITVVCAGANGQVSNETDVTVTLPRTGSETGAIAAVGGACLALGALMIMVARKRPTALRSEA
jgi:LPXTG-motif cell wall-anchored protein